MIASQHLIEHHGTPILIAAWIYNAARLFRSHIANGSAYRNGLTNTRTRLQRTSNTKVSNHQAMIFLVNKNIFGFDVTMNHGTLARMGIVQSLGELMKVVNGL